MKDNGKDDTERKLKPPQERHVAVAVATTSGTYPERGYDREPARRELRAVLEKAARKLQIVNTSGWIATVNDREVNISASYIENGLQDEVTIDYGPREGGGGCA